MFSVEHNTLTHTEDIKMAKYIVRTIVAIELEVEADSVDSAIDLAGTKICDSIDDATFDFFEETQVFDQHGEQLETE